MCERCSFGIQYGPVPPFSDPVTADVASDRDDIITLVSFDTDGVNRSLFVDHSE